MTQPPLSKPELLAARTLEVERSVLGGILVDADRYHDAREHVTESDFYRVAHRIVFRALTRLADAGKPIDVVMVMQELTAQELEDVGGPAWLAQLLDGVPRAMNVSYYAREVAEKASLRALAQQARRILAAAEDADEEPSAILDDAERSILAIRDRHTRIDVASPAQRGAATYRQIEQITSGHALRGLPTGLTELDQDLRGLHPGNLIVVAARPSMGKTSLAQTFAIAAGRPDAPVLFFSLEMSGDEVNMREVTTRAAVNSWRLQHGRSTAWEQRRLMGALEEMQEGGVHVADNPHVTVGQIGAISRRKKNHDGLCMVVIDYLQLIVAEERRGRSAENRTLELGAMSRTLKAMARELRIPVVLLSQLSRGPEARPDKKPQLSDLRESGAIEQDADVVLLLFRPNAYEDIRKKQLFADHYAEIILAKQRNGPTGIVKVAYYRDYTKFSDYTEDAQPVPQQATLAPADPPLEADA